MRKLLKASAFLFAAACIPAAAEKLKPARTFETCDALDKKGCKPFYEKGDAADGMATNISGAACAPSGDGWMRHCLAVNDESRSAQFFDLDGRRIVAGDTLKLIGDVEDAATLGEKVHKDKTAAHSCLDEDPEFKNLDGEGVAYAKETNFFYVVGSHGCSRKRNEFVRSAFILARFPANGAGPVETTYRLADALRMAPRVSAFFGRNLNRSDGLNIEGLAIIGADLIAGLRAPSLDGRAFLVKIRADALFARGHDRLTENPAVIPIALGDNVGIRDLAALSDGRLLILAGPTLEQEDIPFSLYAVDLASGQPKRLAVLEEEEDAPSGKRPKAEAMVVLGEKPLRLLIFFDGLKNGAPKEYVIPE